MHHSDRGSPYASADYRRALARARAVASMSRKGDCWDNAIDEALELGTLDRDEKRRVERYREQLANES